MAPQTHNNLKPLKKMVANAIAKRLIIMPDDDAGVIGSPKEQHTCAAPTTRLFFY